MLRLLMFLTGCSLLLPQFMFGQTQKGNLMNDFSISLSYDYQPYKSFMVYSAQTTFRVTDNLGFFFIKRLAAGPGITFQLVDYSSGSKQESQHYSFASFEYSISFSPFLRYYFAEFRKIGLFIQGSGNVGYSHSSNQSVGTDTAYTSSNQAIIYGANVQLGMNFFFTKNIGLQGSLGYLFYTFHTPEGTLMDESTTKVGGVEISIGLNFFFGIKKQ